MVNYNSYGLPYSKSTARLVSFLSPVVAEKIISSDTRGNEIPEWMEYTAPGKRTIRKQVPDSIVIAEVLVIDGYEVSKKDFGKHDYDCGAFLHGHGEKGNPYGHARQ